MKKKQLIRHATEALEQVANGNFEARILGTCGDAEIDRLMSLMNDVIDRSDAYIREASACTDHVSQNKYWRRIVTEGMVGDYLNASNQVNTAVGRMSEKVDGFGNILDTFESDLLKIVHVVSQASEQLTSFAEKMGEIAKNTSSNSTAVAAAANEANMNVETVSAASEQLSASINEISHQVSMTTNSMFQTKENATQVKSHVSDLSEMTSNIGQVINMINDISHQTNMLAMNATIEAAHAGNAGKGFGVVASEVKLLANETSKATSEIANKIQTIQSATLKTQNDINLITADIDKLAGANASVSAAVEQQTSATGEIARNIIQASSGTSEVSNKITMVSEDAKQTENAAIQVKEAAEKLSIQASLLDKDVTDFMQKARAVV